MLAGHTDTVPVTPLWQSDPFQLRDRTNAFMAWAVAMMKGFFPVALHAAAAFVERDLAHLNHCRHLDEESSMAGSRYLLKSGKPKLTTPLLVSPRRCIPSMLIKA